jgi:hypothetical protein
MHDLEMREPERSAPGRRVSLIALAVGGLLCGRSVIGESVGFDD